MPRWRAEKLLAVPVIAGAVFLAISAWLFGEIAEDVINHDAFLGVVDHKVASWLHAHATPTMTTLMIFVSYFGAPLASLLIGTAAAITLWGRRQRDAVLLVILTVPCGMLLNVIMKFAVQRQRPTFADPIVTLSSYSFPSGHALGSTVLYGVLAVVVVWTVKDRRWRVLAVGSALLLVLLVCFSRIYLGVHFLSDVVAGFLAGIAWLALCLFAVTLFRRERTRGDG